MKTKPHHQGQPESARKTGKARKRQENKVSANDHGGAAKDQPAATPSPGRRTNRKAPPATEKTATAAGKASPKNPSRTGNVSPGAKPHRSKAHLEDLHASLQTALLSQPQAPSAAQSQKAARSLSPSHPVTHTVSAKRAPSPRNAARSANRRFSPIASVSPSPHSKAAIESRQSQIYGLPISHS